MVYGESKSIVECIPDSVVRFDMTRLRTEPGGHAAQPLCSKARGGEVLPINIEQIME